MLIISEEKQVEVDDFLRPPMQGQLPPPMTDELPLLNSIKSEKEEERKDEKSQALLGLDIKKVGKVFSDEKDLEKLHEVLEYARY